VLRRPHRRRRRHGASREAEDQRVERLRAIDARGSTDLGGGFLPRRRTGRNGPRARGDRGVNRVLLLTDGLANQGITDPPS